MTRPLLLDLFCGAGGAAMGYHRAGFDVVGVDIAPQPHYPFEFHQQDALAFYPSIIGRHFDAIHASPPCQHYSTATADPSKHPDLYEPTRQALASTGLPWVIENVIGSPYDSGIVLCGSMFGMQVQRHRNFETSFLLMQPHHDHADFGGERPYTVTGHLSTEQDYKHSRKPSRDQALELMDVTWMNWHEAVLAIPPAYTEFIGRHLLDVVGTSRADERSTPHDTHRTMVLPAAGGAVPPHMCRTAPTVGDPSADNPKFDLGVGWVDLVDDLTETLVDGEADAVEVGQVDDLDDFAQVVAAGHPVADLHLIGTDEDTVDWLAGSHTHSQPQTTGVVNHKSGVS